MKTFSKFVLSGLTVVLGLTISACGSDSNAGDKSARQPVEGVADIAGYAPDDAACQRNKDAGKITYISSYSYAASGSIMDVFMARDLGYYDALCLDVEMNTAGASGQQLVNANKAQFTSVGSAPSVLDTVANADNITAVATYGTTDPHCILAHKDIKTLKDLEGKRLGYFTQVAPVARAQLAKAGVDLDKVKFTKITNYDPTIVTRGTIDAEIAYASSQCASLKDQGVEFSEFLPADAGVESTYSVMEVNSTFLKEHRDTAADFMRATLKALQYCLDNEDKCVEHVTELAGEDNQGDSFPLDQQKRTWAVESQWIRDSTVKPLGAHTREEWEAAAALTREYSDVKEIPDLDTVVDFDLVTDLYDANDVLIWPGE